MFCLKTKYFFFGCIVSTHGQGLSADQVNNNPIFYADLQMDCVRTKARLYTVPIPGYFQVAKPHSNLIKWQIRHNACRKWLTLEPGSSLNFSKLSFLVVMLSSYQRCSQVVKCKSESILKSLRSSLKSLRTSPSQVVWVKSQVSELESESSLKSLS